MIFKKKKEEPKAVQPLPPPAKVVYPGMCVKTERGYWFIKSKNTRLRLDAMVVLSWNFPYIVRSTEEYLKKYLEVGSTGFRDGAFIRSETGKLYVITGRKKRPVSDSILQEYGLDESIVFTANEYLLNMHDTIE